MVNPYTSRNMVKAPDRFFGRTRAIEEVRANLIEFQNTSIVGESRSGKSSLLWHICNNLRTDLMDFGGDRRPIVFVYFDLQRVAALSQSAFFRLLCDAIRDALPEAVCRDLGNSVITGDYRDVFGTLVEKAHLHTRLVVCLDEFEIFGVNEEFGAVLLLYLRSFANAGSLAFVTASREPLETICRSRNHLQGSDFWNIFVVPPTYLGSLEPNEADALITEPFAAAAIALSASDVDFIKQIAGLQPLFLQIACFYVFEELKLKRLVNDAAKLGELEKKRVLDAFVVAATPHFEHIWSRLSEAQRRILAVAAQIEPEHYEKYAIRELARRGLLLRADGGLRTFSQAFALFAQQKLPADRGYVKPLEASVPLSPPNEGPSAAALTSAPRRSGRRASDRSGHLTVWLARTFDVLVELSGPLHLAQFCQNRANLEPNTVKRFETRVREIPRVPTWRVEKQEIGNDVFDLFERTPELAQLYTSGRSAVGDDERFVLTFKCPQEMIGLPFEFINTLSMLDEGPRHLVLTHPFRKSVVGIRSRRLPLSPGFHLDAESRVLLVASNVHGEITVERKQYQLPSIPGADQEVREIEQLIQNAAAQGLCKCSVDVTHDVTASELRRLLREGEYDVVHFSGHGWYSDVPENSGLVFWKDASRNSTEVLTASELNELVEPSRVRFMYLSCCEGAETGTADQLLTSDFLGITHSLLIAGVPAILAMRWPLNDTMAVLLATSFYGELLRGATLETALYRARRRVQVSMPNDVTWLSPVLIVQGV